jgi:hypothetical protein
MKNKTTIQQLGTILLIAFSLFVPACATQSDVAARTDIQSALVQAGFKVKPATTAPQQRRLQRLPEHQFTAVTQNGEHFYVWADKANHRLYCGTEQAYHSYKQSQKLRRERESGEITWISEPGETPVDVFDEWAPFRQW